MAEREQAHVGDDHRSFGHAFGTAVLSAPADGAREQAGAIAAVATHGCAASSLLNEGISTLVAQVDATNPPPSRSSARATVA